MKIIKFIGYSGSGKTTLIEKIVDKLTKNGIKVATIKHDVHGLDIDKVGKDSYRYSKAGAKVSAVSSDDLTVIKIHKHLTLKEIIEKIEDVDIIIIEGYSSEDGIPIIQVARRETGKGFKTDINNNIAIVSDYDTKDLTDLGFNGKSFDINDIDNIVDFINYKL